MAGMRADNSIRNAELLTHSSKASGTTFAARCLQGLPIKQKLFLTISHIMIIFSVICILYGILDTEVLPGSEIFALFLLYALAVIGGKIVKCIWLPPLLGMLIAGFLFRNLPFIPFYKDISVRWASALRGSTLVIILVKAGLGLDAEKLKQLKTIILQLSFTPCLIETITIAIASHFLINLPWMWALLLGFVIAAVSPAVVVPSLLSLQEKKYGIHKGVPTLVVAAASAENIIAITGFTIMLSISLSEGSWIWSLAKGILEPLAGFIFGVSCGYILWHIPGKDMPKLSLSGYRVILLCCGSLAVMFMSTALGVAGAGPFGCLVFAFVASVGWKKDSETFSKIERGISCLWKLLEPFLFSLIGCEVTIASLGKDIGSSILVLFVGLLLRILTALLATFRGGFDWKEKVFVAIAWLPKATVQAAVGPQALDFVLVNGKGSEMEEYAKRVLTVAVLSILMTAPIGAVLIALLGPLLLSHDEGDIEEQQPVHVETEKSSQILGRYPSKNLWKHYGSM